jgi:multidrug efflux pump subunit AcrA (membrane-fusion protein)
MTAPEARRRRWRRHAVTGALGLVAAAALVWWAVGDEEREWLEVDRGPLVVGAETSGTLRAVRSDLLGPPLVDGVWNYKISFLAPEGTEVAAGTPVVRFDTTDLERQMLEKEAERDAASAELDKLRTEVHRDRRDAELRLAEAEARLRKAELKVEVPAELVGANELAASRIDLELASDEVAHLGRRIELLALQGRARIAALAERRDRAAARVAEIGATIGRMTVQAPSAGTVIHYASRNREKPKVGDTVWMRDKVVEIPDLARMEAEGEIDEADAGRIVPGLPVALRLDAHPDRLYRGRVSGVRDSVQRRSSASPEKVVRIEIALDETDPERMRPGMRFQGEIEVERIEDALRAPADAVFGGPGGAVAFRDGRIGLEPVRPEIGLRAGDWVQVLDGLEAGDRLAARPPPDWRGGA